VTGELHGKLALVTGAADGIGRETALALSRAGAELWLCDVDEAKLAATADRARAEAPAGAQVRWRAVDVGRRESMAAFAEEVHATTRPLDVLVNNAGVGLAGGFLDTSLDDWAWVLGVNLWGTIHGCHYFVPPMAARGSGQVVNVASAAAFFNTPAMTAYGTSKYAVFGMSEALRDELAPRGVGVSVICPGLVRTAMVETMRMRGDDFPARDRGRLVALYERRGCRPERIASAILHAVRTNRAVVPVNAEAWGLYLAKRATPALARGMVRFARRWIDAPAGAPPDGEPPTGEDADAAGGPLNGGR
jgi:NAD(P)-dependent dehydrogenase (short-subunit alcohol dehydrogenase family)